MKHYLNIIAEIAENNKKADELNAAADQLLKKAEKAAAETWGDRKRINETITEEAEAEAVKLYTRAEELKSINKILSENANASFAEYVTPIIKDIMQKYNGKQYGEKTRQKIYTAAHETGISFYFDGYREKDTIHVYCLSPEGYKAYNMPEIRIHATDTEGKRSYFISETNKINDFSTVKFSTYYNYTEDPSEKREQLKKKYEEFSKLVELASKAEKELNALLPEKVNHFNVIGHLSPWTKF